jgi:hypothetical protein
MDVLGYMASDPEIFRKVSRVILGEDPHPVKLRKLIIAKDCFNAVNPQLYADLKPAIDHVAANLSSVEEREISPDGLDSWMKFGAAMVDGCAHIARSFREVHVNAWNGLQQ